MITGSSGCSAWIRRSTVSPSRSGSIESSRTTSGGAARTSRRAGRPASAVRTSQPSYSQIMAISSRIAGSSSTTRTRRTGTGTSDRGCTRPQWPHRLWDRCATGADPLCRPGSLVLGAVAQVRREPSLRLGDRPALAAGVVLDLVAGDPAQVEVPRLRVGEVQPADRGPRPHGHALGELDAGVGLDVEQLPDRLLLGVLRARRVARRRPDAGVLLG